MKILVGLFAALEVVLADEAVHVGAVEAGGLGNATPGQGAAAGNVLAKMRTIKSDRVVQLLKDAAVPAPDQPAAANSSSGSALGLPLSTDTFERSAGVKPSRPRKPSQRTSNVG